MSIASLRLVSTVGMACLAKPTIMDSVQSPRLSKALEERHVTTV